MKNRICKCGISRALPYRHNVWKCLDCGGIKPKSKKGYKIIEAEHLYKQGKENLQRLATLLIIIGIFLLIIGMGKI